MRKVTQLDMLVECTKIMNKATTTDDGDEHNSSETPSNEKDDSEGGENDGAEYETGTIEWREERTVKRQTV